MNILWVSMVEFPPLCEQLHKKAPAFGGWLYSSAKAFLSLSQDIKFGVISFSNDKHFASYSIDGIAYYTIPSRSIEQVDNKQIEYCRIAITEFHPDIIHIHGTEYSLAKAVCIANNKKSLLVANIQGLASVCVRYADGGIPLTSKLLNITPLDIVRHTALLSLKNNMHKRAKCEISVIKNIDHIIGRTAWDHDHAVTINPKICYHHMNETLRPSFYQEPFWSFDKCVKHTVFVSNCSFALKGAHQVLKALPIVVSKFPDVIVNFCGPDIMCNSLRKKIRFQGYHIYLRKLVRKYGLQKHVRFMGALSESQMKQAYLEANVYVLPSDIENSSNSLCEAQILGVPVVASYCGGTSSLVLEGVTGYLYRYEEYEMLAQHIIRLFECKDFNELSIQERNAAIKRHNPLVNANRLNEIYNEILNKANA